MLFKISSGLFAHSVATLLPKVDQLVESDQASLMLLSKEIGSSRATRAGGSNEDHIELLFVLECRGHLYLELVSEHLGKFSLMVTL